MGYPPVCYEIFVRSFCDSNNDGIGDINGVTSKLDYLFDLGIRGIWLTPIQPSPSYHKYDVTDYYGIDAEYGTLEEYRLLLSEAHKRGIKVYMDLVIHHTSIQHKWFLSAKGSPQSLYRRYYRWMTKEQITDLGLGVRELTQDAHTVNPWHKLHGDDERYLGVFSREMADLNFDHAPLSSEMDRIIHFWLNEVGVDGFRLDAARHIYPVWESERNPIFWREFSRRVENVKPDAFLVGEVWADTDEVAPYYEGLKANFNFDLWMRIGEVFTHCRHLDLVKWLRSQRKTFEAVSEGFVDAIMLSNHDQQRIGSTLKGRPGLMKLAAAILLTLPGQPYLYYGEEIGMLGKKPDPFLREPFLWGDSNSDTRWKVPKFSKLGVVKPLADALCEADSLYYCYKNLIRIRNRHPEIGAVNFTRIEEVADVPESVLAYVRPGDDRVFLIFHNLLNKPQNIALPLEYPARKFVRYATSPDYNLNVSLLRLGGYNSLIIQVEKD